MRRAAGFSRIRYSGIIALVYSRYRVSGIGFVSLSLSLRRRDLWASYEESARAQEMTRGRVGRSLFPVRGFLPAGIVAGAARVARMQILCVYIGVQDGIAARDEVFAMRCGGGALCVMDERFIGCFRAIGGMSKYKCCTEFRFCETIEINLIGCI